VSSTIGNREQNLITLRPHPVKVTTHNVFWFKQNKEYARAVLDYADAISDREVRDLSRRLRFAKRLH